MAELRANSPTKAGFGQYPPNLVSQDALIIRTAAPPEHAATPYTAEEIARPNLGPQNPFKDNTNSLTHKRKNGLTGHAEEIHIDEHTFRSKHRAIERRLSPHQEYVSGAQIKEEAASLRFLRESKGNATIAEGPGAYIGPWAKHRREDNGIPKARTTAIASGDEEGFEVVEEVEGDEDVVEEYVESGTVILPPTAALARRLEVEELGDETTTFHGTAEYDYQGRTYMQVPQDLDIDLKKDPSTITNYIPKKLVHTWRHHSQPITVLRFFPGSGHLLLSGSADNTIKIADVYHAKELLRTYSGHSKAITDLSFNLDGTRLLSGSFDRKIQLWDTETGSCFGHFTTGKTPHVIKFNPDPAHRDEFLAGMSDKKIIQFDTRMGNKVVQEYDHHLAAINTIEFVDQNRRFMTTSDDKSLRAWDYEIPVPIKYIAETHMYPMTRSTRHPSGKYVAYQSSDNQIVVYGANEKFKQNRKKSFRGHNNAGTAIDVDFSPDGQFLASGDCGGYVCFWDWKTCKMYHKIQASNQAITCVKWHPQETSKVVTAGNAGEIKYWD